MFAASKTASVTSSYQISRSLRFNSADSAYLNKTPASATNRRTWTLSTWLKLSAFGSQVFILGAGVDGDNRTDIRFDADSLQFVNIVANVTNANLKTTQVFRDPSAWYHIVIAVDSTQATSTNRIKIYINGVQITDFGTATYFSQNTDTFVNNNCGQTIGRYSISGSNYLNGYLTEFNLIDGQALTPSSFGATIPITNVWSPTSYIGTYGTNGFYLNFSDNSNTTAATLGKDYSGNGNNYTPNNFSVTAGAGNDSLVDSPTSYGTDTGTGGEVRGNYCTLNPLDFANGTISNGSLDWSATSGTGLGCFSTFAFDIADSTNQYYWEFTFNSGDLVFGIVPTTTLPSNTSRTGSYSYYTNGNKYSGVTASAYGAGFTSGAIIGVAVGGGTITFYKNGVSQGAAFTGLTGIFKPAIWEVVCTATANFGQRPFAYTAPSGYKALCTQNLPMPTIGIGGQYFNPVLYTGTGSTLSVTGVGFQPDWVWVKGRSSGADHAFYDAVRGVQKQIESNTTTAETTETTGLTAFGTDGFTTGALAQMNTSAATYVAWNWKANGAGSSNTSGSITSTVSANTTSGFSVVTYTGSGVAGTIGHGLGVAPSMIIVKSRSATGAWPVYHKSIGNGSNLVLNTTAASASSATIWNSTSPTSSVFSVGINTDSNTVLVTYVAYCFVEVAGYSKFGSYTGNDSTNGPFAYCGFRPAFVLIKSASQSGVDWVIFDTKRSTSNVVSGPLFPNAVSTEGNSTPQLDILSNGFKWRNSNANSYPGNVNGDTYIFAAFAESPFKYALAR